MENFWTRLARPFFVLAPMEDVTDVAFRTLIAKYSSPDVPRVIFTEFTSADGLIRADEAGLRKLRKKLEYGEGERPVVAQLFTANPEYMEKGARLCGELGFDGFDINMGCPANEVVRQQCGAALIQNPTLARELIRAAKRGAESASRRMPVSVKTRVGFNVVELDTWLPELLAEEPAAVTIHARTRKDMSEVPARWEHIARAVEIRNDCQGDALTKTLIIGNGDVTDLADARERAAATTCDGVMIGRGVFGNPWLFSGRRDLPTPEEKMRALVEHIELFQEHLCGYQNEAVMKRHFKAYIGGWDGAKELRIHLMDAPSLDDAKNLLNERLRA
jgi:nifR3 family TIM-barrel protein